MARILSAFSPDDSARFSFDIKQFEPLLDSVEAAALLRIHPKTLKKMARRGEIRGTQIGKLWRFRASDLDEWISSRNPAS
jgi:excisionase family DNA binding protein